jgi:hypothetical protein
MNVQQISESVSHHDDVVRELVPVVWDDVRDLAFFHLTAAVFSCQFVLGASVLLASYDDAS